MASNVDRWETETTIQQSSPMIRYDPPSSWRTGTADSDSLYSNYSDGMRVALDDRASATLEFYGTAIQIYGALRPNHGTFEVELDGETTAGDGFAEEHETQFQVPLFETNDLVNGAHTITFRNTGSEPGRLLNDIDLIRWTTVVPETSAEVRIEAEDTNWDNDGSWGNTNSGGTGFHTTVEQGGATVCRFEGQALQLFGIVGPDTGVFTVNVDESPNNFRTINGSYENVVYGVLLYSVDSLGYGQHTMRIRNGAEGSRGRVDLDYFVVRRDPPQISTSQTSTSTSTSSSSEPTSDIPENKVPIAAIAGGTVGGIVFLALGAIIFVLWRRRSLSKIINFGGQPDLNGASMSPTPFTATSSHPSDDRTQITTEKQGRSGMMGLLRPHASMHKPSEPTSITTPPTTHASVPSSSFSPFPVTPQELAPALSPFSSPAQKPPKPLTPPTLSPRDPQGTTPSQPNSSLSPDRTEGTTVLDSASTYMPPPPNYWQALRDSGT